MVCVSLEKYGLGTPILGNFPCSIWLCRCLVVAQPGIRFGRLAGIIEKLLHGSSLRIQNCKGVTSNLEQDLGVNIQWFFGVRLPELCFAKATKHTSSRHRHLKAEQVRKNKNQNGFPSLALLQVSDHALNLKRKVYLSKNCSMAPSNKTPSNMQKFPFETKKVYTWWLAPHWIAPQVNKAKLHQTLSHS